MTSNKHEPFNIEGIFRDAMEGDPADTTAVFDSDSSTPLEGPVIVEGEISDIIDQTFSGNGDKKHRGLRVAAGAFLGVAAATACTVGVGQLLVNFLENSTDHDKQKATGDVPSAIALPTTSRTPLLLPVPTVTSSPTEITSEEPSDESTVTAIPEPTPTVTVTQSAEPVPKVTVTATATATQTIMLPPQVVPTSPSPTSQSTATPNALIVGVTTEQQDERKSFFDKMRGWFRHHDGQVELQASTVKNNVVAALQASGYIVIDTSPTDGVTPNLTIAFNDGANAVRYETSGWNIQPEHACLSTQYGTIIQQELGGTFPLVPGNESGAFAGEPVLHIGLSDNVNQNDVSVAIVNGVEAIQ